jgi:uncharacterized membrane protein YdjX (TVP38/TMEM64 family)
MTTLRLVEGVTILVSCSILGGAGLYLRRIEIMQPPSETRYWFRLIIVCAIILVVGLPIVVFDPLLR